jgi:hypothetical protein
MNTMLKTLTVAATLAVLAGCSTAAPSGVATGIGAVGASAQERTVDMTANLRITGEGGYRVQALTAWNLADIDHVKLTLTKNGTAIATKSIARAALAQPVTLNNLKMATSYKIVAQAFADANETNAIDNTAEAGSDAANSVGFTTPSLVTSANGDNIDDAARTVVIPVRLKNKNFAGQASAGAGVAVTNGTIVNTGNTESF